MMGGVGDCRRNAAWWVGLWIVAGCGAEPPPPEVPPPPTVIAVPEPEPAAPAPSVLQIAQDAAPAVSYKCSGGSLFIAGDRPLCVQTQPSPFAESKRWCDDNGGKLLVVDTPALSDSLQATFAAPNPLGDRAWFGLVQLRSGEWRWSTGAPARFFAWMPGEPNDAGGEHCGELQQASGQWNDLNCDTPLPFVCEARGRGTAPGKLACSGRSFQVGTTTYCADPGRRASWGEAENTCKRQGGTLASFDSEADLRAFHAVTRSPAGTDRIWLGLTDEAHEGRFTDARDRGVDFTKWRAGEPNNAGGENCVEWFSFDAGWNDIPCNIPHVGICVPP